MVGKLLGGLVVGLLVGCASPPPSPLPPAPAAEGLRVMTYNVLGAMGDDAVYSEHAGWAARIDQLSPDVLVVQEAQAADVQAILQRTETAYTRAAYVQWACDLKPEREGVAILVKATIGTTGGGGTNVGSSCVNPSVKRVLVWADIETETGPLRVYGTHLSQGGSSYDESRNNQIRLIRGVIEADDPTDSRRWVLAGDLNTRPQDLSYRLIMGDVPEEPGPYRMVDTFAEARPGAEDRGVCPSFDSGDAAGMAFLLDNPDHVRDCGYTAGWPKDSNWIACDLLSLCISWQTRQVTSVRERIDYVLHAEGAPIDVIDSFVPNRSDGDWSAVGQEWFRLSDHLPLVVDLGIGEMGEVVSPIA